MVTLSDDKILGLEKTTAIIFLSIVGFFILAVILLYLATVFVNEKDNKIIERLGKYRKTVKPGWNFMLPLFDSVVATIDMSEKVFRNKDFLTITSKDGNCFVINFDVTYNVVDASAYYYACDKFNDSFGSLCAKTIVSFYLKQNIQTVEELIKLGEENLLKEFNESTKTFGIKLNSLNFTSVGK